MGFSHPKKKTCQGGALPLLARLEAALPGGPGDLQHMAAATGNRLGRYFP